MPTFAILQQRLIRSVQSRIQNGELTERGLARVIGISQPQMHNVLKGARPLKQPLADRLMQKLDLNVMDLLEREELLTQIELIFGAENRIIRTGNGQLVSLPPRKPAETEKAKRKPPEGVGRLPGSNRLAC